MDIDIKSFIAGTITGAVAIEFIEHIVLKKYPGDENRRIGNAFGLIKFAGTKRKLRKPIEKNCARCGNPLPKLISGDNHGTDRLGRKICAFCFDDVYMWGKENTKEDEWKAEEWKGYNYGGGGASDSDYDEAREYMDEGYDYDEPDEVDSGAICPVCSKEFDVYENPNVVSAEYKDSKDHRWICSEKCYRKTKDIFNRL